MTVLRPARDSAAREAFPERWADRTPGAEAPAALGDADPLVPPADDAELAA